MRQYVITPNALEHMKEITDFLFQGGEAIAQKYYSTAEANFLNLSDIMRPRRASENLPEYVREIGVKNFKGYTLRIAYIGDKVGLVAAFRPGLTHNMKNVRTRVGMRQFRQK